MSTNLVFDEILNNYIISNNVLELLEGKISRRKLAKLVSERHVYLIPDE